MNAEIKMTSNVDTLQLQVLSNLDQTNKKKKKLKRVLAHFFLHWDWWHVGAIIFFWFESN